jgi:trk system potassium uptake protein TrkA
MPGTGLKILIIGAGRVGSQLAILLSRLGHSITIIDKDEDKIVKIGTQADVEGLVRDATDPQLYDEIDFHSYDVIVATTDRDEVNLFVAAIAKLYNIGRVFVRAKNPQTTSLLELLGVEAVVVEPMLAANILYSLVQGRYGIMDMVATLTGDFHLVSGLVKETSVLRGKRITEALREGLIPGGVKVLAVFDGENFYEIEDAPPLDVGSIVIALVRSNALKEFSVLF